MGRRAETGLTIVMNFGNGCHWLKVFRQKLPANNKHPSRFHRLPKMSEEGDCDSFHGRCYMRVPLDEKKQLIKAAWRDTTLNESLFPFFIRLFLTMGYDSNLISLDLWDICFLLLLEVRLTFEGQNLAKRGHRPTMQIMKS